MAKRIGHAAGTRAGRAGPRHLFAAWDQIAARLRGAKRVALLLDFDGTLVDLQARPGQVRLRAPVRRVLGRLARDSRVQVVIVSGRTQADIRRRIGVAGARYIGLYGWDHGNARTAADKRVRRRVEEAKNAVRTELRGLPGIWVEDKGLAFVIHYRGASRKVAYRASRVVRHAIHEFRPWLRIFSGKKNWDVVPSLFRGKGAAVSALLARHPETTLSVYAGDDTADESAFRALRRGITVRVGRLQNTQAGFYLRNPEEVLRFLERLEEQILCGRQNHSAS